MRKLSLVLAVMAATLLLWLGWLWSEGRREEAPAAPMVATPRAGGPTDVETDPVKVFQRALWANPASDDQILHAERREWKDAEGLQKWQWFLVVKPSPALLKRLREDNAFGLMPAAEVSRLISPPAWFYFQPGEISVMKAAAGGMQLIFSKDLKTLHATDSGLGFRPGLPEPAKSPSPAATAKPGRLINTPPPLPPR